MFVEFLELEKGKENENEKEHERKRWLPLVRFACFPSLSLSSLNILTGRFLGLKRGLKRPQFKEELEISKHQNEQILIKLVSWLATVRETKQLQIERRKQLREIELF